jgi:ribulose-5-phosphate 4-epimerase/fuculose-1-phosphate aldolase
MPTTPTTPPTTSPSQTRTALLEATTAPPTALLRTLITANHILHHHDVVDAFGHISVRNPHNPRTFLLSRSVAPACVARRQDIEEYRVADAGAVLAEAAPGYAERFIHSEIYARYRDVHCVVHCHSEAVIPFGVASVPLRPVFHMGGVMGNAIPVSSSSSSSSSSPFLSPSPSSSSRPAS